MERIDLKKTGLIYICISIIAFAAYHYEERGRFHRDTFNDWYLKNPDSRSIEYNLLLKKVGFYEEELDLKKLNKATIKYHVDNEASPRANNELVYYSLYQGDTANDLNVVNALNDVNEKVARLTAERSLMCDYHCKKSNFVLNSYDCILIPFALLSIAMVFYQLILNIKLSKEVEAQI